ncbi:hypothetical protein FPV67DRAFT_1668704 [Lyophyllum atratum]|nr:hypothetical protein FPV67DRAFT_1668704 [Lyophyllum atratum]
MAASPLNVEYVALQILTHLNIADSFSYSLTSHANCHFVRAHMLAVVRTVLDPFFLYCWQYDQFWAVLTATKGVLSGDLALAIMQPLAQRRPRLDVLMIYVPHGAAAAIATFFHAIGYEDIFAPAVSGSKYSWQRMRAFRRSTIVVCLESYGSSVLPLVLTAPCTAVMNAVTATKVYMFYPTLTLDGLGTVHAHWPQDYLAEYYGHQGIHLRRRDEFTPGEPCSYDCPGVMRRVRGDKNIAVVTWNGTGADASGHALETDRFAWTLGGRCTNPNCRYRFRRQRRSARSHPGRSTLVNLG